MRLAYAPTTTGQRWRRRRRCECHYHNNVYCGYLNRRRLSWWTSDACAAHPTRRFCAPRSTGRPAMYIIIHYIALKAIAISGAPRARTSMYASITHATAAYLYNTVSTRVAVSLPSGPLRRSYTVLLIIIRQVFKIIYDQSL